MGDETPKKAGMSAEVQLTREKKPPLRDEKGRFSQKKPTRSGNTDIRTWRVKEWRAKRKLEFQGMVEDWSPPKKRETGLSQVLFKSCFHYTWHQAIYLKVLRQVLHQDFLWSEIVLNLNFCTVPQVVQIISSTRLYLNILTFHFKIPTNVLLQLQPNNTITVKTYKFWILIRINKEGKFHSMWK